MSDFDDDFAATLLADMFGVFGTSATYARGSSSATVTVIRETGDNRTQGDEAFRIHANVVRLRVKASDIDFGSGAVTPEIGDKITVSGVEFRVEPFGDTDRPWAWASEDRTTYMIDTTEA